MWVKPGLTKSGDVQNRRTAILGGLATPPDPLIGWRAGQGLFKMGGFVSHVSNLLRCKAVGDSCPTSGRERQLWSCGHHAWG